MLPELEPASSSLRGQRVISDLLHVWLLSSEPAGKSHADLPALPCSRGLGNPGGGALWTLHSLIVRAIFLCLAGSRALRQSATMSQQGATLQNYNNELVKCAQPRLSPVACEPCARIAVAI